jgi:outer membrane protein assembly factor BamB
MSFGLTIRFPPGSARRSCPVLRRRDRLVSWRGRRRSLSNSARFVFSLLYLSPCALLASAAPPDSGVWQHQDLRRFKAREANQGVAVDADCFYAIDNRAIGKYRKTTGARVGGWEGAENGPLKHLNAGVVIDGKLYCAHSNFPEMPEKSSVEIWDADTMQHIGQHVFDEPPGSLTWAVKRGGEWFACFAHYRKTGDPARTGVVKFDAQWRPLAHWSFPAALIQRFAGNSSSGGAFGPGGHLFVTGHDVPELYVLDVPDAGGELLWRATIPISAAGQAFAWDVSDPGALYSIARKTREVIVSRILEPMK